MRTRTTYQLRESRKDKIDKEKGIKAEMEVKDLD